MTIKKLIEFLQKDIDMNPWMADKIINDQLGGEIHGMSIGSNGVSLTSDYHPEHNDESKWEKFEAMFILAGIKVLNHYEIPNGYWPKSYVATCLENPWWLVITEAGPVKIGWRKRVIEISWVDTKVKYVPTEDDVTKSNTYVHAWSELKALEYLKELKSFFNKE